MATCYIIDDDIHAIEAITKYIVKIPNLTLIGSATNPLVGLEEIRNDQKPNIVFLDVEMPELSGIELAGLLDPSIAVIFTTSHSKYAVQAFQKDAVDFLLKPFSFEMFLKAIEKVRSRTKNIGSKNSNDDIETIFINTGIKGKIVQINIMDIIYIETIKNSVNIYTNSITYQSRISLKAVQTKLLSNYFIRIHRSYTINLKLIRSIEGNVVIMSNGRSLPMGELYKNDLMKKIEPKTIKGSSDNY